MAVRKVFGKLIPDVTQPYKLQIFFGLFLDVFFFLAITGGVEYGSYKTSVSRKVERCNYVLEGGEFPKKEVI